nr:uncharacterized protein LOC107449203 [Parasteatoda tepidariorum]
MICLLTLLMFLISSSSFPTSPPSDEDIDEEYYSSPCGKFDGDGEYDIIIDENVIDDSDESYEDMNISDSEIDEDDPTNMDNVIEFMGYICGNKTDDKNRRRKRQL